MAVYIKLGDVHKDWIAHLSQTRADCRVFSPYLTSSTAEEVLQSVRTGALEIYTVFSVENFAAGGSSLETLKKLLDAEIPVFHLQDLHAKIVWSGRQFLTIGSQNLTHRGTQQKEATAIIHKTSIPLQLRETFKSWIKERRAITRGMIASVEKILPELRRKADLLKEEAKDIERNLWQREVSLLETKVKRCRSRLKKLGSDQSVPRKIAEEFVKSTAYWIDHPCGTRWSPGDACHLYGSDPDWCIYAGNTFVVGRAILRCRKILKEFLAHAIKGVALDFETLRGRLKDAVRMSVKNCNGAEYSLFPVKKGIYDEHDQYLAVEYMKFGTHGIFIGEFVDKILQEVGVESILGGE